MQRLLINNVKTQFEQAVSISHKNNMTRFSKLLYPLGLHKQAIDSYFFFIKDLINTQSTQIFQYLDNQKGIHSEESESIIYSEVLGKLILFVDNIIREHKENIENEFGATVFIDFCRFLQKEIGILGVQILDKFYLDKKSMLHFNIDNNQAKIDFQKLDMILDGLCTLNKLCQNFDSYLRSCSKIVWKTIAVDSDYMNNIEKHTLNKKDGLLIISPLNRRMQELMGLYVSLEHFHMQRSIQRASDERDEISWLEIDQFNSTMVEDIFYIFQKSLLRAIDSSDVFSACAVVNHVNSLLAIDVKARFEQKMKTSYSLYQDYISRLDNLSHFKLIDTLPENIKKSIDNSSIFYGCAYSWTHTVNNIQACKEYISLLQKKCEDEFREQFEKNDDEDENENTESFSIMFHHTLTNLESVCIELETMHVLTCKMTLNALKSFIFPYLIPLDSMNFDITEAEYSDYQVNDPFLKNFLKAMKVINYHLTTFLNTISNTQCIQILVVKIAKAVEVVALRKKFTLLGAIQFDEIVRSLMSFFFSISSKSLRSKFSRLIEICDILSLTTLNEFSDLWDLSKKWKLNESEIRQVLISRTDFREEDIANYFS